MYTKFITGFTPCIPCYSELYNLTVLSWQLAESDKKLRIKEICRFLGGFSIFCFPDKRTKKIGICELQLLGQDENSLEKYSIYKIIHPWSELLDTGKNTINYSLYFTFKWRPWVAGTVEMEPFLPVKEIIPAVILIGRHYIV